MKPLSSLMVTLALTAQAACGGGGPKAPPKSDEAADDRAVRKLSKEFAGIFSGQRPTRLSKLDDMLDEGFVQIGADGKVIVGRVKAMKLARQALVGLGQQLDSWDAKLKIRSVRVRPNHAVVYGQIVLTGQLKGGGPFARARWETLVFSRKGGKWLLIHEHVSLPAGS